jgi:C4-type Zn-finger protein
MRNIQRRTKGETNKCPICGHKNTYELTNPCPHILNVIETAGRSQMGWQDYYRWTYEVPQTHKHLLGI